MKISLASFVVFAGILLLLSTVAYSDFIATRTFFILRSSIAFSITLPGGSAVNSTNTSLPPGNAVYTGDIEFNVTNKSTAWVNASVAPCCTNIQNGSIPIFNYTNLGSVALNISLYFNGTTMPPGVNVTASNGSAYLGSMTSLLATGGIGCGRGSGVALTDAPDNGSANAEKRCSNITTTSTTMISDLQPGQWRGLYIWAFFDNFPETAGTVGTGSTRNLTSQSQPKS